MIERTVNQIDSDDAERFLLIDVCLIKHADVDNNLAWFTAVLGLKANAEPAMRLAMLLKASCRYRVGKYEEGTLMTELLVQPLDQQTVFTVEHCLQTLAADVTIGRAINRVAKRHVVSRHRFRDCPRCAADVEESPCYFLAGADLDERAVALSVKINLERLLVRSDIHLGLHTLED